MRRLWVACAWMVLLSLVPASRTWSADPPKSPLLTKAAQILKLTSEESQRRYPVQIRGVVTFCDFEWSLLFVQDDTAGVYVAYAGQRSEVTAGQRVAVEGNSEQGLYSSYVRDARVTVEGPGALPPARPTTLAQMLTGAGDSQWVEVAGVVNSATHQASRSILMLNVENHRVRVTILGLTQAEATRLLDAQVRIRGVCAVISNEQGQVTDAQLFVPSLAEVIVDVGQRGPITRLTAPVRTIRETRLSPRAQAGQAIRIRGVVSRWSPGNWLKVSDPTGTLRVRSADEKVLTNDVLVEVFGKLSWNQEEAELSQANYWRMGVGQPLTPEQANQTVRASLGGPPMPVLKRTEMIRRLDSASAGLGQPVSLSGVITYYDWANNDCYLQDETGAIWIDTEAWELDLAAGDLVVVEGYTRSGYAPCVTHPRFAVIGRGHLPDKAPVGSPRLLKGIEDSQWVSVVGVVHALTRVDENAQADLRTVDGNRMDLVIRSSEQEPLPSQLQGARVQAQGVCASRVNLKRQLAGVYLLIPHTNQIRILNSPRPDPFSLPVKPIASLMQFSAKEQEDERVHIQGSVTLLRQGKTLYVHDVGDGLRVEMRAPVDFKPGEWVEVVGFPTTGGPTPLVRDAIARRMPASGGPASTPTAVSAEEALSGKFDSDLVTIEATFLEQAMGLADEVLLLQKGERVFEAFLEKGAGAHLPALRTGSLLRITGICSVQVNDNQEPKSFHLLLRGPADVQVLKAPMGWMLRYAYRLVWILTLISAAALAWIVLLRKKVREQTEIVRRRLVAEAALEARYRELVDNASEIIFTVDLTGKWTSINKAAERVLLYSKDEIRSIPPENLIVPEHHQQISNILERLRAGATPRTEELEILNRARRRITLEINARLLLKEGEPSGLDCIARDITERKQAEAALRESEERFRTLVDNEPDGLFIHAAERFVYLNPAALRMLGGSAPEQLVGRRVIERVHPDYHAAARERMTQLTEKRCAVPWVELKYVSLDASIIDVEVFASPITFQATPAALVFFHDITDRKRAEEITRQSEERYRHLVESSNDWVWETDAEFNYTYASPHVRVLLGYEPEQVVGKKPFDFMSLEEAERVGQAFSLIAAQRKPFRNLENRNQHRDGHVVVLETNGVPIVDGQGNLRGYRGMGRNITERKQAEEEKARLETQLRQAQKLEAIGTLAGGIAHDFNNILGIIIPYVELAKLESGSNGAVQESLSEVGKAAHRAKELVKQILTFSRQTHLERKPIRLQPVVSEALKMLRSALPTTLKILEHVDFEAPPVLSDSSQIHQVLMNLCSNASHAMRDRPGHIEVGLHAFETDAQFLLQHPDMQPGKYARLVVTDTGHGMDQSTLKRAFDPFFTTKAPGEGTGLGLAVVHGIVNDHKGYIYAQSRPGAGTRFDLFFPACAAPPVDGVQEPDQSETTRGHGEHILFVDDEPKLAKIASRVLERLGYRVTSFCCPLEALDDFRAHPASYDLVLTDLNMPGMMGIELAQELLQIRPDVRILLATGFSGTWTSEEVKKLGLTDLIHKPLTPAGLTEAIEAALNTVRAA